MNVSKKCILKDYPLIIKIIKMTLDILKNYICSKQTVGQTNAQPVNMSSIHLQCDSDNIEKRTKMLILKKSAPQKHILDNDDEPPSMYDAIQRLKTELKIFYFHHCNYVLIQWNWLSRSIGCKTLKENETVVSTELFSQTIV
jgi:hypothetical protein